MENKNELSAKTEKPFSSKSLETKHIIHTQKNIPRLKKFLLSIILLFSVIILLYAFLVIPYAVFGKPLLPFTTDQIVFGERISYLFTDPKLGDRITFHKGYMSYVGVITKINTTDTTTIYQVDSSRNVHPWIVTKDKIDTKIYYPFMTNQEVLTIVKKDIGTVEQKDTTMQSSQTPTYTHPLLAHWKLYTANGFSFQYPDDWYLQPSTTSDPEFAYTTIQNYDPRTAEGREYSPTKDKGSVRIDFMKRPLACTITELKKTLEKQDKQTARDYGREYTPSLYTEKIIPRGDTTIYIRSSDDYSIAYVLNGKGDVIVVGPGLDWKAEMTVFNELLPTIQFTQ